MNEYTLPQGISRDDTTHGETYYTAAQVRAAFEAGESAGSHVWCEARQDHDMLQWAGRQVVAAFEALGRTTEIGGLLQARAKCEETMVALKRVLGPATEQRGPMSRIAKTKLADLIAKGYRECGAMIELAHSDSKVTRGAVSNGGMVIWWHPEQMEAAHTRAQQAEAQPVGGTSLNELSGALMNNAPLNTDQRSALYELLIAAAQPKAAPLTQAASDVLAERQRQISAEGWTPEHDDEHDSGELAAAASAYALAAADAMHPQSQGDGGFDGDNPPPMWPWSRDWWKPSDPRRNLVKATALAFAEIERWDRAHTSTTTRGKP